MARDYKREYAVRSKKGRNDRQYRRIARRLMAKKLGIKKLHDTIKIEQEIPRIVALNVGFKDIEIIKKDGKHYAYSMIKEL